jgi:hypothetical protein
MDGSSAGIRTLSATVFELTGISASVNTLMLQDNSIEEIPSSIFSPFSDSSLTTLRLDGNKLETLPTALLDPIQHSLRVLALNRNQLGYLDIHIFTELMRLRELYVSNNPALGCVPDLPATIPPVQVYKDASMIFCPTCTEAGVVLYFGQAACGPCVPGTYSPASEEAKYGECDPCPANSTSLVGSASVFDCKCVPGYTGPDGGPCFPCANGQYKAANGSMPCTACPDFTTSSAGSNNISQCICTPGHTGIAGRECLPCSFGTFKEAAGSSPCLPCMPGTYSNITSAVDPEACTPCPGNSLSPAGSQDITNCSCIAGYTGPDGGECTSCRQGTYKTEIGQGKCNECLRGTYSLTVAATSNATCISCPPNSLSGQGADDQAACVCNAGYSGPNGGPCSPCAAGLFKNSNGSASCIPCRAGSYADTVSTCRQCPSPLTSLAASADFSYCLCPAGLLGPGLAGEGLELLPPMSDALLTRAGFRGHASSANSTALVFLDSAGYYGHKASLVGMTNYTLVCSQEAQVTFEEASFRQNLFDLPPQLDTMDANADGCVNYTEFAAYEWPWQSPDFGAIAALIDDPACLSAAEIASVHAGYQCASASNDMWVDSDGDGCEYYDANPEDCPGAPGWADEDGYDALMVCCVCGGGLGYAAPVPPPRCEVTFSNLDPSKAVWVTIDVANTDFASRSEYIASAHASVRSELLCEGHGHSESECLAIGSQFGQPGCCQWAADTLASDHGWPPAPRTDGVGACVRAAAREMCDSHFLGADFLASGGEDQQCEKMSRIVDSLYLPRAAAGGEITILLTASPAVGGGLFAICIADTSLRGVLIVSRIVH